MQVRIILEGLQRNDQTWKGMNFSGAEGHGSSMSSSIVRFIQSQPGYQNDEDNQKKLKAIGDENNEIGELL